MLDLLANLPPVVQDSVGLFTSSTADCIGIVTLCVVVSVLAYEALTHKEK